MSLQYEVLKELVVDYQKSKSASTFARILKRVDRLLLDTIHKYVRRNTYLNKIELRDLYHTSIVGLGRAIITSKSKESGEQIVARIIRYVQWQIDKFYPNPKRKIKIVSDSTSPAKENFYNPSISETELEGRLILENLERLKNEGILPEEDYKLLIDKYIVGKSYKVLAKELDILPISVQKRMERIMKRVRRWYSDGRNQEKSPAWSSTEGGSV
jgi:DNA-directed RNA polymerase specialized sigma24 family protein